MKISREESLICNLFSPKKIIIDSLALIETLLICNWKAKIKEDEEKKEAIEAKDYQTAARLLLAEKAKAAP